MCPKADFLIKIKVPTRKIIRQKKCVEMPIIR